MIQIEIPMPKNCGECPICNQYLMCGVPRNGRGWCENNVSDYFSKGRPEWCPLKEQEAVVRCKDCKHGQYELWDNGECVDKTVFCDGYGIHKPNWFCADGEQK